MNEQEGPKSDQLEGRVLSRTKGSGVRGGMVALVCAFVVGAFTLTAAVAETTASTATVGNPTPLSIQLKQFKVLKGDRGDVKFVDASIVMPGDVVEYRAVYSNRGSVALPVVATLPIPEGMEYQKDSASANNKVTHTVALDDSKFAKEPLLKKLVSASGTTLSQPLPYASYRYVRWDLGTLSPGKSVEVSVQAKVAQNLEVDASNEDKASSVPSVLFSKK